MLASPPHPLAEDLWVPASATLRVSTAGQRSLVCAGTRDGDRARLEHLVKAGVNVVVLDSSQGDSTYALNMLSFVKKAYPDLDVIAG
jgi:pyruvate kinase